MRSNEELVWAKNPVGRFVILYAIRDQAAVGTIVLGKRDAEGWVLEKVF